MQPILAGRKIVPPARGEVLVEYTTAVTRRDGPNVVTRLQVKNVGLAPIARLTFTETWYDKAGVIVTGNKGVINGLFQPGEVQTLTISTPYDARMSGNRQGFSHANGTVKTTRVVKFDVPKPPAAADSRDEEAGGRDQEVSRPTAGSRTSRPRCDAGPPPGGTAT